MARKESAGRRTSPVSNNRRVLVTGGSRGIGQGIALELARAGWQVAIAHWQDDAVAAATAQQVEAESGKECPVIASDLGTAEGAAQTFDAAIARLGGVEALVNNAGICEYSAIQALAAEHIDRIMHVNFRSPLLLMKEAAGYMIANGTRGSIVNITSSRAERAYPGDAVYGGLKAALRRATESAALDLAPYSIRVNAVAPGAVAVRGPNEWSRRLGERIPLGRVGEPEDIGKAVAWLVSDESRYATGISLRMDGGLILPGMPE